MQAALSLDELKMKLKAAAVAAGVSAFAGAPGQAVAREWFKGKDAGQVERVQVGAVESIDEAARTATFVMSDATRDHVGDRLLPDGARTANFDRNPQFLWMHDKDSPPIGKWLRVWVENGQLKGTAYFTPAEIDEPGDPAHSFSERCWSLVKAGILNAVSVFFKGIDAIWNGDGFDVLEWDLLECSLVTVGMNPNALLDGKSVAALLEGRMKPKTLTEEDAGAGGSAVKPEDIEKCMKGLQDMHGQMAKALTEHAKLVAAQADIVTKHAKALADADAHAAKLGAVHQDLQAALDAMHAEPGPDESTKKAAAELRTRADALLGEAKKVGTTDAAKSEDLRREATELQAKAAELLAEKSSKVLSEKNYGRIKTAMDHCKAVLDEHDAKHGGTEAEPAKAIDFDTWFKSLTPEQLVATARELAAQQIAQKRGEIT